MEIYAEIRDGRGLSRATISQPHARAAAISRNKLDARLNGGGLLLTMVSWILVGYAFIYFAFLVGSGRRNGGLASSAHKAPPAQVAAPTKAVQPIIRRAPWGRAPELKRGRQGPREHGRCGDKKTQSKG